MDLNLDKIMEQALGPEDTFRFKCRQCGKCCRNREDILLSPYDLFRLAKYLKIKSSEVIEQYCETYIGQVSNFPVVRLKPKGAGRVCPLLSGDQCSVHRAKPVVCAIYPLGRIALSENDIRYFLQGNVCGKRNQQHTVKEWLADFDISESGQSMLIWNKLLFYFTEVKDKFQKFSDVIKQLVWNLILASVYTHYDTEQDFLPQLEINVGKFIEAMDVIISMK
ncbi:MAG: YkgJ family cysteine cluster protein [Firmicutes bacterium]|nr:YkgJ family cysteine cluster protein [Bacillota bacterium]